MKKHFLDATRPLLLFLIVVTPFYLKAQDLRNVLERTWWGHGQIRTDIVEGGTLLVSFELREVKVSDDNTVTAKLTETFTLNGKSYRRKSGMQGTIYMSQNKVELKDVYVISSDGLPNPFSWDDNSFYLTVGRNRDVPGGYAMSGSGKSGVTSFSKVWFQDSQYY
jgi:hypothetical protein